MNIQNNISRQAFTGFYVQDEKMNSHQKSLSVDILDSITYSDDYLNAHRKNIDVYITPNAKKANKVNVRYMDAENGYYLRDGKKIVQTTVESGNVLKQSDNIISQLKDILSGKYKFRGFDAKLFENVNSDLFKVRPDLFKAFRNSI